MKKITLLFMALMLLFALGCNIKQDCTSSGWGTGGTSTAGSSSGQTCTTDANGSLVCVPLATSSSTATGGGSGATGGGKTDIGFTG